MDLAGFGNVARKEDRAASILLDRLYGCDGRAAINVENDNMGALFGKQQCDGLTDA